MQFRAHFVLFFLVLATVFFSTTPQTFTLLAGCRNIQGVDYINYEEIQGIWYEYAKSPRANENNARCVTFVLDMPIRGEEGITRHQVNEGLLGDRVSTVKRNQSITGAGKTINLSNYNVTYVDVEYDKYLVVYSCQNQLIGSSDVTWILTREKSPPCDVILKSYDSFWKYGLSLDNLEKTNHTNCPETWEESPGLFEGIFGSRG